MLYHWPIWLMIAAVYATLFGAPRLGAQILLGITYAVLGIGLAYLAIWCRVNRVGWRVASGRNAR